MTTPCMAERSSHGSLAQERHIQAKRGSAPYAQENTLRERTALDVQELIHSIL